MHGHTMRMTYRAKLYDPNRILHTKFMMNQSRRSFCLLHLSQFGQQGQRHKDHLAPLARLAPDPDVYIHCE